MDPKPDHIQHVFKHSGGRRFHDATTGADVTIESIRALSAMTTNVVVLDADTGTDVTKLVLAAP